MTNREFWKLFNGQMPSCTCGLHEIATPNGHKPLRPNTVPVFKLHYGPDSAPILAELRARLSVLLYRETQDAVVIDAELDALAPQLGKGAKQVLARLRKFELGR
jgi:hypothetical protein